MSSRPGPTLLPTVILPAYNEEGGLTQLLPELRQALGERAEILVVDDGSTDGTARVARHLGARLVRHPANMGKGAAVLSGLHRARGQAVVVMDADGTYPPQAVPQMLDLLAESDLVIGVRGHGRQHIPWLNRLGNGLFRAALRWGYGYRGSDPLSGLYAARKHTLEAMALSAPGFELECEISVKATRMGLRLRELPIQYGPRLGQKKLHPLRDGWKALRTLGQLAILYNPDVAFLLPGGLALVLGGLLLGRLLLGPLTVGSAELDVHTALAVAAVSLAGLQILVFGLVSKLYATAHRFSAPGRLVRLLASPWTLRMGAMAGVLALAMGLLLGGYLGLGWMRGGFGPFLRTRAAILSFFLLLLGVEVLFSAALLSAFTEAVRRRRAHQQAGTAAGPTRGEESPDRAG